MTSSPGHGLNEGKDYSLRLGSTFEKNSRAQESYHVLRCKYNGCLKKELLKVFFHSYFVIFTFKFPVSEGSNFFFFFWPEFSTQLAKINFLKVIRCKFPCKLILPICKFKVKVTFSQRVPWFPVSLPLFTFQFQELIGFSGYRRCAQRCLIVLYIMHLALKG